MVIRWFSGRPGLVNGLVHAGLGFGITVLPPLASFLIARLEWSNAYLVLGAMTGVLIVGCSQFLRQEPELVRSPAAAPQASPNAFSGVSSLSLRQALGTRAFWILSLLFFADIYNINTVMVHIVIHAEDVLLPSAVAVSVLSVTAALSIAGRVGAGALADRLDRKSAVGIGMGLNAVAFVILLVSHQAWAFYLFAVLFGLGGWSAGAVMSPFVAEYFGLKAHGVILGTVTFIGTLGGAIGPWVAGRVFDTMNTYNPAFIVAASLAAISVILVALLGRQGGQS
jgi:predicted MFS family arabinose efflux permease